MSDPEVWWQRLADGLGVPNDHERIVAAIALPNFLEGSSHQQRKAIAAIVLAAVNAGTEGILDAVLAQGLEADRYHACELFLKRANFDGIAGLDADEALLPRLLSTAESIWEAFLSAP